MRLKSGPARHIKATPPHCHIPPRHQNCHHRDALCLMRVNFIHPSCIIHPFYPFPSSPTVNSTSYQVSPAIIIPSAPLIIASPPNNASRIHTTTISPITQHHHDAHAHSHRLPPSAALPALAPLIQHHAHRRQPLRPSTHKIPLHHPVTVLLRRAPSPLAAARTANARRDPPAPTRRVSKPHPRGEGRPEVARSARRGEDPFLPWCRRCN